jgi:hypothetical protein
VDLDEPSLTALRDLSDLILAQRGSSREELSGRWKARRLPLNGWHDGFEAVPAMRGLRSKSHWIALRKSAAFFISCNSDGRARMQPKKMTNSAT